MQVRANVFTSPVKSYFTLNKSKKPCDVIPKRKIHQHHKLKKNKKKQETIKKKVLFVGRREEAWETPDDNNKAKLMKIMLEFIVVDDQPLSMRFPRLIGHPEPRYVMPNQNEVAVPHLCTLVNSSQNARKMLLWWFLKADMWSANMCPVIKFHTAE